MTLAEVIAQVRAECPSFATVTHVFTPAESWALPAAVVSPIDYRAAPDELMDDTQVTQMTRRTFGVYIVIRRASDPASGATAADSFDTLHDEVRTALQGFVSADEDWSHMIYAGGQMRTFEQGAPAVWRDDFSAEAYQP